MVASVRATISLSSTTRTRVSLMRGICRTPGPTLEHYHFVPAPGRTSTTDRVVAPAAGVVIRSGDMKSILRMLGLALVLLAPGIAQAAPAAPAAPAAESGRYRSD